MENNRWVEHVVDYGRPIGQGGDWWRIEWGGGSVHCRNGRVWRAAQRRLAGLPSRSQWSP